MARFLANQQMISVTLDDTIPAYSHVPLRNSLTMPRIVKDPLRPAFTLISAHLTMSRIVKPLPASPSPALTRITKTAKRI